MSLHAHLSDEAKSRLESQKKQSTISSVMIALLCITFIGILFGAIFLNEVIIDPNDDDTITVYPISEPVPPTPETTPTDRIKQAPTAPAQPPNWITTLTPTRLTIPDADTDAPPELVLSDNPTDHFAIEQNPFPPNRDNIYIKPSFQNRCSEADRARRMKEAGGNAKCEKAVVSALNFLKKTQNADGSWDDHYQPAMTGLALLAFLGHCETPQSQRYGDTVTKAITYLINVGMQNDGKLTNDPGNKHWSYEHAVATYALGEAYTFCKTQKSGFPNLENVTKKAGQLIIDSQGSGGGWGYAYKGDGDLSIIGWQLQALKAVDHSGIKLKGLNGCIDKAMSNLEKHQTPDGGFNYGKNGSNPKAAKVGYRNLTGVGVLSMQIWGQGKSKSALNGVKYISENSKFEFNGSASDIYGHYYDAQAMINQGGKEWDQYNNMIRDELLKNQESDGSWKTPKMGVNITTPTYRTALCALTLEVYYRFLPSADGSH